MSGLINTGTIRKLLWPGVNQIFGDVNDTYQFEHKEIFDISQSDKNFEDDVQMVNMGLATIKAEGEAISFDSFKQGFVKRYIHTVYGKGFAVSMEALDDIQYGISLLAKGSSYMANSMAQTKEIIAANVLNNAFSSSYLGGDAKALLASDHPLGGAGGTFANIPTVAVDLSEAALEQAVIDINSLVDDAGLRIALRPGKLIVPVQLQFDAERILNSPARVGTADNDLNALKSRGSISLAPVINHYLTDTDAWFIKIDGLPSDQGMRHFQKAGYKLDMDNDFTTKNMLVTCTERYSFGWSNPRAMYGSAGA